MEVAGKRTPSSSLCGQKVIEASVNIYALCLPPRSKLSTSSPAEATARHHGKQTLRDSGLDVPRNDTYIAKVSNGASFEE
jgi:hypothetical protein